MSQQNVNLDNILDKKVRAKKSLIGSVEAKSESFILVASPAGTKYNVPRSYIERRAGNELLLDISYKELQRFKIK